MSFPDRCRRGRERPTSSRRVPDEKRDRLSTCRDQQEAAAASSDDLEVVEAGNVRAADDKAFATAEAVVVHKSRGSSQGIFLNGCQIFKL